jgi:hypothetical protein
MLVTAAYKNRRRRKRLRHRAKLAADGGDRLETSHPHPMRGDWGKFRALTRGDLSLIRGGLRRGWPRSNRRRLRLKREILKLAIHSVSADMRIAASRTFGAMDEQAQRREAAVIDRLQSTPEGRQLVRAFALAFLLSTHRSKPTRIPTP